MPRVNKMVPKDRTEGTVGVDEIVLSRELREGVAVKGDVRAPPCILVSIAPSSQCTLPRFPNHRTHA